MKKSILLLLIAALLLCCFVGCSSSDDGQDSDYEEESFSYSELNIDLPSEFKSSPASSGMLANSDEHAVKVIRVSLSNITPKEGYEFPTIETFFSLSGYIDDMSETDVKEEDGLKIAEFDRDKNGENDVMYVLMETENAYWAVSFSEYTDEKDNDENDKKEPSNYDYNAARASYIEWAKTVTFSALED